MQYQIFNVFWDDRVLISYSVLLNTVSNGIRITLHLNFRINSIV